MIPSVGTSVANEAFEYIFGDNSQIALVFQSPTISNDGQPSTSLNWGYPNQLTRLRCLHRAGRHSFRVENRIFHEIFALYTSFHRSNERIRP